MKCAVCDKKMGPESKMEDVCNECWDYGCYCIEEDEDVYTECGMCGELSCLRHMKQGMCSYCFSVNVGVE